MTEEEMNQCFDNMTDAQRQAATPQAAFRVSLCVLIPNGGFTQ
jgi:hypothetical protein